MSKIKIILLIRTNLIRRTEAATISQAGKRAYIIHANRSLRRIIWIIKWNIDWLTHWVEKPRA